MDSLKRPRTAAFTLIELLAAMTIIGILLAIVIPTVGIVRKTAQRTVDANNLREIGKAAIIYAADNNDRLPDPLSTSAQTNVTANSNYFRWMGLLARAGSMPDPSFYFSKNDPLFDGDLPPTVLNPDDTNRRQVISALQQKTPSFEFVGGVRMSDAATTPIAFTRGLNTNGVWTETEGVYGSEGGHIVFVGGNVTFYKSIDNTLVSTKGRYTNDIRETIPFLTGGNQRIYGKNSAFASEVGVPSVPAQ